MICGRWQLLCSSIICVTRHLRPLRHASRAPLTFETAFAASSTGLLIKTLGLSVTAIKIDPYLNLDAGTMSPTEHGQCRRA